MEFTPYQLSALSLLSQFPGTDATTQLMEEIRSSETLEFVRLAQAAYEAAKDEEKSASQG